MNNIQSDIQKVFQTQVANQHSIRNTSYKERNLKLKKIEDWLIDHKDPIREAMHKDFHKPSAEVDLTEIWSVVNEIRHIRRRLKQWMKPEHVQPTLPFVATKAWIQYEPKGVALIITPWNFPFNVSISPLVSAIASGNCAILKPSELTPCSAKVISQMVSELFSQNEVATFEGGPEVADELLDLPFNHIFFTGGPKIGSIVMEKAAKNLSSVTLELGGKSPTIVDKTANLKDAARKIAWGKFSNCGQTCLAPDYVLVHRSVKDELLINIKDASRKLFQGSKDSVMDSKDYARIVNSKHYDRLSGLINKAKESGDTLYMGGATDPNSDYIEPTVFTDLNDTSPLMQEEIFGPILPILVFDSLEEAVAKINSMPKPLGLYIFSRTKKNIDYILNTTSAGGTSINDTVLHYIHLNLPFGGINNSGFGRTHGHSGFKAFSNHRSVLKQSSLSPLKLLYPPYTSRVKRLIKLLIKYI